MFPFRVKTALLALSTALLIANAAPGEDLITEISPGNSTISLYDPFVVEANVDASFKDPHDPSEVELNAYLTGPDGKEIIMPGFFTGRNRKWEVRYTPPRAGRYSYYIGLKTKDFFQKSSVYSFEVKPSPNDGFLRKSANNQYYLVFDSGKPFFGLGHNVCWTQDNSASTFRGYFSKLAKSGCNMTRIWLNNAWTLKIEFNKLASYNMEDSGQLDRILEEAKASGIYVILTLDSYSSLMAEKGSWNEQSWAKNVYNSKNGGPCEKPGDFFTNPEAKRLYKKRLRYIISRWSYSPNIFVFELWNEMDAPREWVAEMITYVKSINPHGQPVTTSLGYPWANNFDESTIWSLEGVDLVERHIYGNMAADIEGYVISTNRALSEKYRKPMLIEEFAMDWGKSDDECDPEGKGIVLHNGIWAAAMTGSFAGTMGWWWDTYMVKHDLYFNYRSFRDFIKDVNWDSKKVIFAKTSPLMKKIPETEKIVYSNVTFSGKEVWGDMSYREFTVEASGDLSGGVLNHYLHGSVKKGIRIEPVIHVDYPVQGEFIIHVGMVSQEARLVVTLDGAEVLSKDFLTGPGEGPWQNSFFRKDEKAYQCYYGTAEGIKVPKGRHTIKISNTGKDWLGIKRITLTNYKPSDVANARVAGLIVGEDMLFWIQNKEYNWYNLAQKETGPAPIVGTYFSISDIEDGGYEIQWHDTFTGGVISRERKEASGGKMTVEVPDFSKDIACRIKKS